MFYSFVDRGRHKIRKFAVEIFQNVNNLWQVCAKYVAWLLLRYELTGMTLHSTLLYILPVLHCLRGDAFGF